MRDQNKSVGQFLARFHRLNVVESVGEISIVMATINRVFSSHRPTEAHAAAAGTGATAAEISLPVRSSPLCMQM